MEMERERERPLGLQQRERERQQELQLLRKKNHELAQQTKKLEEKVRSLQKVINKHILVFPFLAVGQKTIIALAYGSGERADE